MKKFSIKLASLLLVTSTLAACGGEKETPPTPAPAASTGQASQAPASGEPVAYDGPALDITISPVGNTLKFDKSEFTVAPGQTVHLVFNNTADNMAMSHNVVVVRAESVINPIGQAAMVASDTDYIPVNMNSDIIAHTSMSAPGETVEVTFTAPSTPGDYPYICTFPGHYLSMTGVMRVVK